MDYKDVTYEEIFDNIIEKIKKIENIVKIQSIEIESMKDQLKMLLKKKNKFANLTYL